MTPGAGTLIRREPDHPPQTNPSDYNDAAFSSLDQLVRVSVGASSLPVPDNHDQLNTFGHNQLSPQDHIETGSNSSAPHGNPAAIRWFDLLANDAGKDGVQVAPTQAQMDQDRGFPQSNDDTSPTPLQRATRIVDNEPQESTGQETYGQTPGVDESGLSKRLLERRLWQAEDDIRLIPMEQILFDRFVHQISLSVRMIKRRRGPR